VERETGQMTVARALATSPAAAGGTLVPTEFSSEFIELLRPLSVVRRAGPRTLEFRGVGTISIPRAAGGAAASYIGENTKINYTEMSTDAVLLTPKKIAAITALSNELIRRSNPAADAIVRDDLLAAVASTSDAQFLRGVGSATAPAGLATLAAPANIFNSSGITVDAITADISKAVLALQNSNVRMIKPTWFTSPTVMSTLKRQRDGTGNYIWRDELNQGTLEGYPVFVTTAIPANLGTGTNESQVILADMADIILAEEMSVAVDVSQEAAYVDGSSTLISAFSFDQTVIRVVATHDFNTRHPQSIAVINQVVWA
jgi:HK97 family phage major capsid protein